MIMIAWVIEWLIDRDVLTHAVTESLSVSLTEFFCTNELVILLI